MKLFLTHAAAPENLGAEKDTGDTSPTSIFITWFSGRIEKEINQTADENKMI